MSAMEAALGRKGCAAMNAGKRASDWEPVASTGEVPQEHGAGAKGSARRCTNLELKGPSHLLHPGFSENVSAPTCRYLREHASPASSYWGSRV